MTLRLVLVSLVAGLGLGLPAWPKIEGWVDTTQKWMNARLAEMDVRRGEEKQYVVIHDLLAAEMERARAARLARRHRAVEPAVAPRVATIALPHPTSPRHRAEMLAGRTSSQVVASAVPFPLPKLDDYLVATKIPAPVVAATAPAPDAFVAPVVRPDELARLAWDRFGAAGTRLVETFAEGLREAEARESLALAFAALESSENLYFDDDFTLKADLAPVAEAESVAIVEPTPSTLPEAIFAEAPASIVAEPALLPGFEAMEQSADLYFAAPLIDESAPAPEAFAATPQPRTEAHAAPVAEETGLAMLPADVFAPEEPAVATLVSSEPIVTPDVNRAVRLTREALSAWVNVLTGPALVTASHTTAATR
ncbi:hypothetical protein [Planctomyces sp. SH-PL62]|uniref:hypothetical protein n=1 Tax=Planctomyces sp. SH-PL62 TaxID=1636152 RepID=UPI00078E8BAE|nr:hypothetical protein [Planctomyces sp. SH-PL62]AMV36732.1 hypothetical protein VT85_04830 [Planctomyces sp. SH-PL62]